MLLNQTGFFAELIRAFNMFMYNKQYARNCRRVSQIDLITKPLAPFLVAHLRGWALLWTCWENSLTGGANGMASLGSPGSRPHQWSLGKSKAFPEHLPSLRLPIGGLGQEACRETGSSPGRWGSPLRFTHPFHSDLFLPNTTSTLHPPYWLSLAGRYASPASSCLPHTHFNWDRKHTSPGIFYQPPKRNVKNHVSPL